MHHDVCEFVARSMDVASLAAGVALVHRELDALDERIREDQLGCQRLQQQLEAAGEGLTAERVRVAGVEADAAQQAVAAEDLRLLLLELEAQSSAVASQQLQLEVGCLGRSQSHCQPARRQWREAGRQHAEPIAQPLSNTTP